MPKISTIPGLAQLPITESLLKTPRNFLEARRQIDGAEELWRIGDKLYDLEMFMKTHPGGAEWIRLTKGTDITELFETHHLTDKAEQLLPKFYIRKAASSRSVPLTFLPNDFYCIFKKRAVEALKSVNFHRPSIITNLIIDSLMIMTFAMSFAAAIMHSYTLTIFAGIFLTWMTIAAHNYLHMRDNFRTYYFDISTLSSRNWRISHIMSHHMYPNTSWDYQTYTAEPFLQWFPYKDKSILMAQISRIISPIVWLSFYFDQAIKRYYTLYKEHGVLDVRELIPFLLPLMMSLVTPNITIALKLWLMILLISSSIFAMIGFHAGHHHPDIFHDGDIFRENLDWGLLEVDAVRDREVIDDSIFLALTNFGSHTLHHLLPTVDHHYLYLCLPAFVKTCKEFDVNPEKWTQWELIKGQFRQLGRNKSKKNRR